jgi:hypothetical protein
MSPSIGGGPRLDYPCFAKIGPVSWLYIALLALAVAVVAGAEWPRLGAGLQTRVGIDARRRRERAKRKASLRVVEPPVSDADDFAASVERDLANLPTTEDEYRR